ncbi:MAG: hypothetical protein LE169_00175 [Endomicrobium sp.]|nr:hypothetical protein [Endomicrobium sp.]
MKKIFYCYLTFCFMASYFTGCDKRIINTNNNTLSDKIAPNTIIPVLSVSPQDAFSGIISSFSSALRKLKEHYYIITAAIAIIVISSYYLKYDHDIITLFKRDATHVAQNAKQINEHYELSKESQTPKQDFVSLQKKIVKNLYGTIQTLRRIIDIKKLATNQGLQQIDKDIEEIKKELNQITNQNNKQVDMNNDNNILEENEEIINNAIIFINNDLKAKFIKHLLKDKEKRLIISQQNKIFNMRGTKDLRQKIAKIRGKNYPLSFPYSYFAIEN